MPVLALMLSELSRCSSDRQTSEVRPSSSQKAHAQPSIQQPICPLQEEEEEADFCDSMVVNACYKKDLADYVGLRDSGLYCTLYHVLCTMYILYFLY